MLCCVRVEQHKLHRCSSSYPIHFLDKELVYSSDNNGNNAIYYSCCDGTQDSLDCLCAILAVFKTKLVQYSDLLIKNRIFEHALVDEERSDLQGYKRRGYYCSKTQEWSVRCVLGESQAANI
eukprot:1093947_1